MLTLGVKDLADYITLNLIDQTKTRRQVIKQLIRQNLIGSSKELYQKNRSTGYADTCVCFTRAIESK